MSDWDLLEVMGKMSLEEFLDLHYASAESGPAESEPEPASKPNKMTELEMSFKLGSSEFDVFEFANPRRLEKWRKFADGESDEIGGVSDGVGDCWYIRVREGIAIAYCQCGDFSIRQEVNPAEIRAEIRRHLERFRDGSF